MTNREKNQIIVETIARLIDIQTVKKCDECSSITPNDNAIILTEHFHGEISKYKVQTIREIYSHDILITYTLIIESKDDMIRGLFSVTRTSHCDSIEIVSKRDVYLVTATPTNTFIIADINKATSNGLVDIMLDILSANVNKSTDSIDPKLLELINRYKVLYIKEKVEDESTTITHNN